MPTHKIPEPIQIILRGASIEGNILRVTQKLEPKVYAAVKKVVENAGGKWTRSVQGHVFAGTGLRDFRKSLESGVSVDKISERQAFYTPAHIARYLAQITLSGARRGSTLLEPSIGDGGLVHAAIAQDPSLIVTGVESDPDTVCALRNTGVNWQLLCIDFLQMTPRPDLQFDYILMNPPFGKDQDLKHVMHAWEFLAPGGRMGAIVWPAFLESQYGVKKTFNRWFKEVGGGYEILERAKFGRADIVTVRLAFLKPRLSAAKKAAAALALL